MSKLLSILRVQPALTSARIDISCVPPERGLIGNDGGEPEMERK